MNDDGMILFCQLPVIIPCGVPQKRVHQKLAQFFNLLIAQSVKQRVAITQCDKYDTQYDAEKMEPWKGNFMENALPGNKPDQAVQAKHGKKANDGMNGRVKGISEKEIRIGSPVAE